MFSRFNKGLFIAMVVIALSAIVYAFAASGTFTPTATMASQGSLAVTGYNVTDIAYTSDGLLMTTITLTITTTTGQVAPGFADISTTVAGNFPNWSCAISGSSPAYTATCTPAANTNVSDVAVVNAVIHE